MNEPEVEHPVRFVEDERLDTGQGNGAAIDQVEQTARRGNQDVDAGRKQTLLRAKRHTAEHRGRGEAELAAIGAKAVGNLAGEFAGRAQYQYTAASRRGRPWLAGETVQDRQRESGGFACAGLGDAAQVATGEYEWNGLRLDRRRRDVTLAGEGVENGREKFKIVKTGQVASSGQSPGGRAIARLVGSGDDPRDQAVRLRRD